MVVKWDILIQTDKAGGKKISRLSWIFKNHKATEDLKDQIQVERD